MCIKTLDTVKYKGTLEGYLGQYITGYSQGQISVQSRG